MSYIVNIQSYSCLLTRAYLPVALKRKNLFIQTLFFRGQWLWLSWSSDRFQQQKSAVQIQVSANFIYSQLYLKNYWTEKKEEKEADYGPFLDTLL